MPIEVADSEADALTHKFAGIAGVSITDAIVIVMTEIFERRRGRESTLRAAARLREKHGITWKRRSRKPPPGAAVDQLWTPEAGKLPI